MSGDQRKNQFMIMARFQMPGHISGPAFWDCWVTSHTEVCREKYGLIEDHFWVLKPNDPRNYLEKRRWHMEEVFEPGGGLRGVDYYYQVHAVRTRFGFPSSLARVNIVKGDERPEQVIATSPHSLPIGSSSYISTDIFYEQTRGWQDVQYGTLADEEKYTKVFKNRSYWGKMVKVMSFFNLRPGFTTKDFYSIWNKYHVDNAKKYGLIDDKLWVMRGQIDMRKYLITEYWDNENDFEKWNNSEDRKDGIKNIKDSFSGEKIDDEYHLQIFKDFYTCVYTDDPSSMRATDVDWTKTYTYGKYLPEGWKEKTEAGKSVTGVE